MIVKDFESYKINVGQDEFVVVKYAGILSPNESATICRYSLLGMFGPSARVLLIDDRSDLAIFKMPRPEVRFPRLPSGEGLDLPAYQSAGAAGMDLRAAIPAGEVWALHPDGMLTVPTGFRVALPPGYEGQVRGRGGFGKRGISVTHGVGTVDEDFRGEIQVFLVNHGVEVIEIRRGDRIAQMIVTPVQQADVIEVETLDETDQGEGAFGSTGIK